MPRLVLALALLLGLLAAPSALASGRDVIDDCTEDEVMSKTYTQKEYRDALAKLPADADQYGNCRDIIARAQESSATKGGSKTDTSGGAGTAAGGSGGTGGGTGTPTPESSKPAAEQLAAANAADRAAADAAARDAATPAVGPAASAVDTNAIGTAPDDGGVADLPTPILVLLALLLAGALALAAARIRSLVHARSA